MKYILNHWPLAILFITWEIFGRIVDNKILVPMPIDTLMTLGSMIFTKQYLTALYTSLSVMLIGWLLVLLIIFFLTSITLFNKNIRYFVDYISSGAQVLPTFSMFPIFLLIFGLTIDTIYAMICWSAAWIGTVSLVSATSASRTRWEKYVINLRISKIKALTLVYFPSVMPEIISVLKNSWGASWRILIAIEMVFGALGGRFGLGALMSEQKVVYNTLEVWAILITLLFIGIIVSQGFNYARSKYSW